MRKLSIVIIGCLIAGLTFAQNQQKIPDNKYVLIDLVVLNSGFGQSDRDAYSKDTQEIAKKYGFEKRQSFQVAHKLSGAGPENAMEFNLWTLPSPSAMAGLGQDAAYQANVPKRDKVHNMGELTLYLARPKNGYASFIPKDGKFYLLDFVIMNEGNGPLQRTIYTEKTEKIAIKHGIKKVASYDVIQHLGGLIPDVLEVNLWEMDTPEAMQALGSDPAYQENVPFRDKIHNMQDLTLYMAQAK